jgi:hypothetical protein
MAGLRASQGKGPPPPSFRQEWAATSKVLRDQRAARESERTRLAQEATLAHLAKAPTPRKSTTIKTGSTKRKSAKIPFLISVVAAGAFLFLIRGTPSQTAQSAAPSGASSWTEYVARTGTWATTMAADSAALSRDGSVYDIASLSVDAGTLQTDGESYGLWLDEHGFLPCYHTVWSLSLEADSAYVQAGHWAATWADAAPNGDPDDLTAATEYMKEASSEVNQITGELKNVSCP